MSKRAAEAPERTLREWAEVWATSGDSEMVDAMRAAADEIDRLREQAEGLRTALEIAADALQASADAWEAEDYEGNAKVAATDARKARNAGVQGMRSQASDPWPDVPFRRCYACPANARLNVDRLGYLRCPQCGAGYGRPSKPETDDAK